MPATLRYARRQRFYEAVFGISIAETAFDRRGFHFRDLNARTHLENAGCAFVNGYNHALRENRLEVLSRSLNDVETEFRGFAFEGASMGLALLDHLTPWNTTRLQVFLSGPGRNHKYMVHVGLGWAIARLPPLHLRVERHLTQFDPLLSWLAIDGYGFHHGYFYGRHYLVKQRLPRRLSAYGCRVFDQGLGRSLWFVDGADVERIPTTISAFDSSRQADLWSGVGLACAYAGGVGADAIEFLKRAADTYRPHVAQGAAFAAKARQLSGLRVEGTNVACQILCGTSDLDAAEITDFAIQQLQAEGKYPAYEVWRRRIRNAFA